MTNDEAADVLLGISPTAQAINALAEVLAQIMHAHLGGPGPGGVVVTHTSDTPCLFTFEFVGDEGQRIGRRASEGWCAHQREMERLVDHARALAAAADAQARAAADAIPRPPCDVCGTPATAPSAVDLAQWPDPTTRLLTTAPVGPVKHGCAKHPPRSLVYRYAKKPNGHDEV